MSCNTLL